MSASTEWQTELVEVADGVFAYVQATGGLCISNAGFIVGEDDILIVDSLFTRSMNREFQAQMRRVTAKPASLLINTHQHVDHTLGNALFPESRIISHQRARVEQELTGVPELLTTLLPHWAADFRDLPVRLADVTFEGALELHLGTRRVQVISFPPGHSAGDLVVYLPQDRVLFAGDLAFFRVTPVTFDGYVSGWIRSLDRLAKMDVDVVVPGHGPVGTFQDLRPVREYLTVLRRQARRAHARGLSVQEAAQNLRLDDYADWNEPERAVFNINRLYMEFDGDI
jgi:cyclase